ncbi:MAG: ATP-binding protein [Acidimicrobiales bacterium]
MASDPTADHERPFTRTVVFTDLVDSTRLRAELGEEQADRWQRNHDELCRRAIGDHHGVIVKNTGDGIMAVFESATSAVNGAVAVQHAADRHNRRRSPPLRLRVGVAVGDITTDGEDWFGLPVVEAKRLETAAEPGTIVCSELVRALAGARVDVAFTPLGPIELKGIGAAVEAHVVEWASATPMSRNPPLPEVLHVPDELALTGRRHELGCLVDALDGLLADDAFRFVALMGEPGAGKTRLALELATEAADREVLVVAGHCDELIPSPFEAIVEALRWFLQRHPDTIVDRLGPHVGELAWLLPELPTSVPGVVPAVRADPASDRARLLRAVTASLPALGGERPVLFVLDDLQWADGATVELVRHLIRHRPRGLLVLATVRDTEIADSDALSAALVETRRAGDLVLDVGPIDVGDVATLASSAFASLDGSGTAGRSAPAAAQIHAATAGNPLFVSEYLRHLAGGGDPSTAPSTIADMMQRRVRTLGGDAMAILGHAAVIGHDIGYAVLAHMLADTVADPAELLDTLERACDARLLEDAGPGAFRFSHAMVRSTIYETLSLTRRAQLHHRAAQAYEALYGPFAVEHLSVTAYHWRMAAPLAGEARAVDYALASGERDLADHSLDDALAQLAYAGDATTDPSIRARAQMLQGVAQLRLGDPSHVKTLEQAAAAALDAGDLDTATAALTAHGRWTYAIGAAVPDPRKVALLERAVGVAAGTGADAAQRATLLAALAVEATFTASAEHRTALLDEAMRVAEAAEDPAVQADIVVRACQIHPVATMTIAQHDRLVAETRRSLAALDQLDHALAVRTLNNGFFTMYRAGAVEDAMACAARLDDIFAATGDPFVRRHIDMFEPIRLLLAGDPHASQRCADEVLGRWAADAIPEAFGFYGLETFAAGRELAVLGAMLDAWDEEPDLAHVSTERAVRALALALATPHDGGAKQRLDAAMGNGLDTIVDDAIWLVTVALWAEVAAMVGHLDAVAKTETLLLPWSGRHVVTGGIVLGAVDRLLGLGALAAGRHDEAIARHRAAIEAHRRSPIWSIRSRLDLADALAAAGDERAASDEVAAVRSSPDLACSPANVVRAEAFTTH